MSLDRRRVFVGNLPEDVREDEVRSIFETYGKVEEVSLLEGKRCGFVAYESPEDADAAIEVLNGVYKFREDDENPVRVKIANAKGGKNDGRSDARGDRGGYATSTSSRGYHHGGSSGGPYNNGHGDAGYGGASRGYDAPPPRADAKGKGKGKNGNQRGPKLFVGNLPPNVERGALEYVFKTYGRIEDVHIMQKANASGQACAFVRYGSVAEAESCIEAMSAGYEFRPGDGNLTVRFADEQGSRDASAVGKAGGNQNHNHGYAPPAHPGYGHGAPPGYGAPPSYDHGMYGKGGPSSKAYDYGSNDKGKGKGKEQGGSGPPGCKLYVRGLPNEISQESIEYVFKTYGRLKDVHIMRGRGQGDRSCAFVVYSLVEEAQAAVDAMQVGYEIQPGDGPITVKYANDKPHGRGRGGPY